ARRHRRAPEAGQWWIWYAIAVVGLFLTWGGFTPVAHLVYDIPLFNRQRLLNRNILEVDLALAVLFATWVDRMFTPAIARATGKADAVDSDVGDEENGRHRRWGPGRWTSDIVLPLIPPAAVVLLQLVLLIGGPWFPHLLHVPGLVTRSRLLPLIAMLTIPSAIAVGAGILVVRRRQLGRRLPALLIVLVVVDLLVFNAGIQSTPDPHDASSTSSASANRLTTLLAAQGQGPAGGLHRIGMFDPDRFYPVEANRLGQPDLTILRSLDSVQGYGAVVDEHYDAETGTHLQLNLTPAALSGSTFAQLDLGLLVTAPEYFIHLVDNPPGFGQNISNGALPLPPVGPDPSAPPDRSRPGLTPAGDYLFVSPPSPTATLTPAAPRTQYFGTDLSVTSVTVPLSTGASGSLRVGLLASDGSTRWLGPPTPVTGKSQITADAPGPVSADGIVLMVASGQPMTVGDAVVRTAGQGTYRVDGSLRDIVTSPRWRFVGRDGVFGVFAQSAARGRAWVIGDPRAKALVVSSTAWGAQSIAVRTHHRALLVRSVQFASGWQATVTPLRASGQPKGPSRAAVVKPSGLLQAVSVPAGVDLVRFTYRPARAYEGIALSIVGVIAVAALAGSPVLMRRRRRRRTG
ncbi:MAG TPA: hypothetical protein VIJ09_02015, partial [Acidimicrobiales bacterium]